MYRVCMYESDMKQWRILVVVLSVVSLVLVAHLGSYAVLRTKPKLKRVRDDVEVADVRIGNYASTVSPKWPLPSATGRLADLGNAAENSTENPSTVPVRRHRACWEEEEFQVIGECVKCRESTKNAASSCLETGRRQMVLCKSSKKKVFKSCTENAGLQEKKFLIFEAVMLLVVVCTCAAVRHRQKKLEEMVHEKLKKQMNSETV